MEYFTRFPKLLKNNKIKKDFFKCHEIKVNIVVMERNEMEMTQGEISPAV